jgi:hypothetical protein
MSGSRKPTFGIRYDRHGDCPLGATPPLEVNVTMPISCSVTAALAAAGLIYLGMLPFSVRSFRRLRREAEAPRDELDAIRRESA